MSEQPIPEPANGIAGWRNLLLPFPAGSPLNAIFGRFRWMVPAAGLLGLVATALEGVAIGLMVPLLALLLSEGATVGGSGFFSRVADALPDGLQSVILVLLIVGFIAAKNVIGFANQWLIAWTDSRIGHAIRGELAHRVLTVGYPFFLAEEPARLVNIISGESWRATDAIRHYMVAVASVAAVVAFLLLMTAVNWQLTLAVIAGALLIRWAESRLVARTSHLSAAVAEANKGLAARTLTIIMAMRLIRIFGREDLEQHKFGTTSEKLRRSTMDVWVSGGAISPLVEVLHTLLFAVILIAVVMTDNSISLPELAAFLILLQRMQPHLRVLEQARVGFAGSSGGLREVEWLLNATGNRPAPLGHLLPPPVRGAIEFQNVSFDFGGTRGEQPALCDASFRLEAGRTIALVGPSGAGKSTVVNLLCRLIEPTSGRILVDGVPLSEIDVTQWRGQIALAGQDIDLIEGSIADNITYGADDLDAAAIAEAARRANADGFIGSLPQGYDTPVGDRGLALSGGQRQRIGLARAFARHARLLILDEATNAIDGMSEEVILSLLARRAPEMTVLVISHRESTLANCDRQVVLDRGMVVSQD